jgi:hypothetical protein
MMKWQAFIMRASCDEEGQLRGQIADPATGWRRVFSGIDELELALVSFFDTRQPPQTQTPGESSSPD